MRRAKIEAGFAESNLARAATQETQMSILETWQRPTAASSRTRTHDAIGAAGKPAGAPLAALSCRGDTTASGDEQLTFATLQRASAMLRSSAYGPIRRVRCEVFQRVLTLRGRVPNFYMKQMAQTVVREVLSNDIVINNQVEVGGTERTSIAEEIECLF
jgi:hypothetical protein